MQRFHLGGDLGQYHSKHLLHLLSTIVAERLQSCNGLLI